MKKIIQVCLTAIILLGANTIAKAQYIILPTFFGVNGWMGEKIGEATNNYNCYGLSLNPQQTCNPGGKFDSIILPTCSTKVKSLYVNLVRYGGALNDVNAPTYEQYINEIDKLRSMGSDIILQIPYADGHYTAAQAYDLLYYLNTTRGKNVKYVEIGNEPDKYASYISASNDSLRANVIANFFRPIADTLKVADANIKIIGPSVSFYNRAVDSLLLDSTKTTSQLVKKNHNNKYRLDIVDIHRYPFSGSQTLNNVQKDPNFSSYTGNFASVLTNGSSTGLLDKIKRANTSRSSKLQFSVSEMNIDYANPAPASNSYSGYGANGFIAGQWLAEMYAVILDKARIKSVDAAFVSPWSFHEHGGDSSTYDLGLLVSGSPCNSHVERSTYEHLAMMGKYFKGRFYLGTDTIALNIKAFGTYMPNGYSAFMIINESASDYTYTIHTKSGTSGSQADIDMNTSMSTNYDASGTILKRSTRMIFFDTCGTTPGVLEYCDTSAKVHRAWHATGIIPISLTMSSTPTGCTSNTTSGTATVAASGGSGAYIFSWAPSGGSTSSATGLAAGVYTVYVKNSTGCPATNYSWSVSESVVVTKGSPLSAAISPTRSCAAGSVTFTASGGTSYSWAPSGTTNSTYSWTQPANNRATEYTVYVTDANGCVNTARATHYGAVTVSIESGTTTCGNCCLVSLTATNVQGATYSWFLNGSFSAYTTTNTFSQSTGPGTYTVDILPNDGVCTSSSSANWVVTNNGNPCNCAGPGHRLASESSNSNFNNLISEINSIVPNPASDKAIINYYLNSEDAKGEIRVINIYGQVIETIPISNENSSIEIDCSKYSSGIYFNTLIVNGRAVSSKKLVIAK